MSYVFCYKVNTKTNSQAYNATTNFQLFSKKISFYTLSSLYKDINNFKSPITCISFVNKYSIYYPNYSPSLAS